jgi:hypothetical protein
MRQIGNERRGARNGSPIEATARLGISEQNVFRVLALAAAVALCVAVFGSSTGLPQAPAAEDNWTSLSALPSGTFIQVSLDKTSTKCFLASIDDEKLSCYGGVNSSGTKYAFTRERVTLIKLMRYGRSIVVRVGERGSRQDPPH